MRLGTVVNWALRFAVGAVVVLIAGVVLAVLLVTFEGRQAFPAPEREDAAIVRHLPEYRHRHAFEVGLDQDPATVYAAVRQMDLRQVPVIRLIMETLDAPARVGRLVGLSKSSRPVAVTVDTLTAEFGYQLLEERPGEALVVGKISRPGDAKAGHPPFTAESFGRFATPGWVRTVVSLETAPRTGGGTRLVVEWRALSTDEEARRRYARSQTIARPIAQLVAKTALPRVADELARRGARAAR